MQLVLIGLGGFAGAIARYLVDGLVTDRAGGGFPWGTLVVWRLIEDGAWMLAVTNLGLSLAVGMVALVAGLVLGRAF